METYIYLSFNCPLNYLIHSFNDQQPSQETNNVNDESFFDSYRLDMAHIIIF